MKRDYSASKLQELKGYVNQNMGLWDDAIDIIGDFVILAKSFFGILELDKNIDRLKQYHRDVVDMHNYTCQDLEKIFESVREVDTVYCSRLRITVSDHLKYLNDNLMSFTEMIDPTSSIQFTSSGILALSDSIQRASAKHSELINATFDEVLREKWHRIGKDAAVQALKSAASFGLNLLKTMAAVIKGDPVEAVVSCWDMLDSASQFLFSFISIPVTIIGGMVGSMAYKGEKGRIIAAEQFDKADKQLKIDSVLQSISYYYGEEVNEKGVSQAFKDADDVTKTLKAGYKAYKGVKKTGEFFKGGGDPIEPLQEKAEYIKEHIDTAKERAENIKSISDLVDAYHEGGWFGIVEHCVEEIPLMDLPKKIVKPIKQGIKTVEDINSTIKIFSDNPEIK